jgi:hypothetical protein
VLHTWVSVSPVTEYEEQSNGTVGELIFRSSLRFRRLRYSRPIGDSEAPAKPRHRRDIESDLPVGMSEGIPDGSIRIGDTS